MFSITLLQMPKSSVDVTVIIVTTAATAFIVGTDADAALTVAVVITCVTAAGVFVSTHFIAVARDKTFTVPFGPLKRLVVVSKKKNMEPNLYFNTSKLFSSK